MAPCGAGDPFDCGRRARKSRWKSRAGAESTRLVVLVPKITVLQAWDTLRDCSLAAASVACSALALTNAALAKPTATVALADRRMEFNGQIRSEWTNVAHLKKRFEAPYEAARATRPPNTPNPTKNRPQDTHNTLTEQENSARASSADQLSIRWAIRPKRQNRRLRTLRSPNSRPERAPARAWCGRRRACRPGRWGRS